MRDRAAAGLAARQYGLLSVAQAHDSGFDSDAIAVRVHAGRWERILPAVYRIAGAPERGRQAAMAAVLWAGDDALVSHQTAGVLRGLDGVETARVHVTVPAKRSPRHDAVVVHRTKTLPAMDRDLVHGIPVTSAARTLIDLAGVVDGDVLERAVESALQMGLTTCAFVEWRLGYLAGAGRAGAAELRRLLEERGRGAAALESALEVRVSRVIAASGMPRPLRQYEVVLGDVVVRLDFAWPDARVAVEADGYAFHRGRRAFVKDRARMARLVAAGWRVIPVTWDEVRDAPNAFVANLCAALTHASVKRESVQDRVSAQ